MTAYIYQAALLCEDCGSKVRASLVMGGRAPSNPDNESTYDSDEFPKGPYSDGGGEADTPQHCDICGDFLANPLTDDGRDYVRAAIEEKAGGPLPDSPLGWHELSARLLGDGLPVLSDWAEHYGDSLS